jgi:hypothetical protein
VDLLAKEELDLVFSIKSRATTIMLSFPSIPGTALKFNLCTLHI